MTDASGSVPAERDKVFSGSIPEHYERYFVPLLFAPYAADLARRVRPDVARLLEVAAGSGAVTRALDRALPGSAEIVATDLNQPMLDLAATRLASGRVRWQQADAAALPFGDAEFDAVLCQFGVMFFPDKVAAFREAARVLKPGGAFLFNVWDRIETNEFAAAVTDAMATLFPDDPPRFFARTPHGYSDADEIRATLAAAGFREVAVEAVEMRSRAPSARDAALGFCRGTPLRGEIETRDPGRLEAAVAAAEALLAQRFGAGAIEGRMRALVIAAVR